MTAVEWFANQLGITSGTMLEQAKEMEKQQIEISDEEIEKAMLDRSDLWNDPLCFEIGWKDAIKWYLEQLKKKQ